MAGLEGISTIQPQGRIDAISGGLSAKGKSALDELIRRKGPAAVDMLLSILPRQQSGRRRHKKLCFIRSKHCNNN